MVEAFDVADGKMFQMGTLNFGGMLASKTKQTNKKQQQQQQQKQNNRSWGGGGGEEGADVNSLHFLIDCKSLVIYLSDKCLNNKSLNDTQFF